VQSKSTNRRNFLSTSALAVTAGIGLAPGRQLLGSSFGAPSHTPVEEQLRRIRENRSSHSPAEHIAILGGGMAGLVAALELRKLGFKVSVIEASNRAGGRVWTHRFDDGQYHELGAMRIPASHDYTRHYVHQMGLRLRPFITSHKEPNAFYHIKGKTTRISKASSELLKLYNLSELERAQATSKVAPYIFGAVIGDIIDALDDADIAALFAVPDENGELPMTPLVRELERMSLGRYLSQVVNGIDTKQLIGDTTGLSVWMDGIDEKSVAMFIRDEIVGTGSGLEEIVGGMDRLSHSIATVLGPKDTFDDLAGVIVYNHEVKKIVKGGRGRKVTVTLQKRADQVLRPEAAPPIAIGEPFEQAFDYVICTIPFPVFTKRGIENDFNGAKKAAIRDLTYASSTKVLLHCKDRVWEKQGIFGGASHSDEITQATYYPSDSAAKVRRESFRSLQQPAGQTIEGLFRRVGRGSYSIAPDPFDAPAARLSPAVNSSGNPGVLVGSYSWDAAARKMGAKRRSDDLRHDERVEAVLNVVEKFHPKISEEVIGHESIFWDEHAWAGKAFCFMAPGDLTTHHKNAIDPDGRVHFAGEHCSVDPGWIQGALISSLRAVEQIVARVREANA
jgi:monoamine oxidase